MTDTTSLIEQEDVEKLPEIKTEQLMTWWIKDCYLTIETGNTGLFYAIGRSNAFRGVITGFTLDELYRQAMEAIELFRKYSGPDGKIREEFKPSSTEGSGDA